MASLLWTLREQHELISGSGINGICIAKLTNVTPYSLKQLIDSKLYAFRNQNGDILKFESIWAKRNDTIVHVKNNALSIRSRGVSCREEVDAESIDDLISGLAISRGDGALMVDLNKQAGNKAAVNIRVGRLCSLGLLVKRSVFSARERTAIVHLRKFSCLYEAAGSGYDVEADDAEKKAIIDAVLTVLSNNHVTSMELSALARELGVHRKAMVALKSYIHANASDETIPLVAVDPEESADSSVWHMGIREAATREPPATWAVANMALNEQICSYVAESNGIGLTEVCSNFPIGKKRGARIVNFVAETYKVPLVKLQDGKQAIHRLQPVFLRPYGGYMTPQEDTIDLGGGIVQSNAVAEIAAITGKWKGDITTFQKDERAELVMQTLEENGSWLTVDDVLRSIRTKERQINSSSCGVDRRVLMRVIDSLVEAERILKEDVAVSSADKYAESKTLTIVLDRRAYDVVALRDSAILALRALQTEADADEAMEQSHSLGKKRKAKASDAVAEQVHDDKGRRLKRASSIQRPSVIESDDCSTDADTPKPKVPRKRQSLLKIPKKSRSIWIAALNGCPELILPSKQSDFLTAKLCEKKSESILKYTLGYSPPGFLVAASRFHAFLYAMGTKAVSSNRQKLWTFCLDDLMEAITVRDCFRYFALPEHSLLAIGSNMMQGVDQGRSIELLAEAMKVNGTTLVDLLNKVDGDDWIITHFRTCINRVMAVLLQLKLISSNAEVTAERDEAIQQLIAGSIDTSDFGGETFTMDANEFHDLNEAKLVWSTVILRYFQGNLQCLDETVLSRLGSITGFQPKWLHHSSYSKTLQSSRLRLVMEAFEAVNSAPDTQQSSGPSEAQCAAEALCLEAMPGSKEQEYFYEYDLSIYGSQGRYKSRTSQDDLEIEKQFEPIQKGLSDGEHWSVDEDNLLLQEFFWLYLNRKPVSLPDHMKMPIFEGIEQSPLLLQHLVDADCDKLNVNLIFTKAFLLSVRHTFGACKRRLQTLMRQHHNCRSLLSALVSPNLCSIQPQVALSLNAVLDASNQRQAWIQSRSSLECALFSHLISIYAESVESTKRAEHLLALRIFPPEAIIRVQKELLAHRFIRKAAGHNVKGFELSANFTKCLENGSIATIRDKTDQGDSNVVEYNAAFALQLSSLVAVGATGAHIRLRSLHELETMQNDEDGAGNESHLGQFTKYMNRFHIELKKNGSLNNGAISVDESAPNLDGDAPVEVNATSSHFPSEPAVKLAVEIVEGSGASGISLDCLISRMTSEPHICRSLANNAALAAKEAGLIYGYTDEVDDLCYVAAKYSSVFAFIGEGPWVAPDGNINAAFYHLMQNRVLYTLQTKPGATLLSVQNDALILSPQQTLNILNSLLKDGIISSRSVSKNLSNVSVFDEIGEFPEIVETCYYYDN